MTSTDADVIVRAKTFEMARTTLINEQTFTFFGNKIGTALLSLQIHIVVLVLTHFQRAFLHESTLK